MFWIYFQLKTFLQINCNAILSLNLKKEDFSNDGNWSGNESFFTLSMTIFTCPQNGRELGKSSCNPSGRDFSETLSDVAHFQSSDIRSDMQPYLRSWTWYKYLSLSYHRRRAFLKQRLFTFFEMHLHYNC